MRRRILAVAVGLVSFALALSLLTAGCSSRTTVLAADASSFGTSVCWTEGDRHGALGPHSLDVDASESATQAAQVAWRLLMADSLARDVYLVHYRFRSGDSSASLPLMRLRHVFPLYAPGTTGSGGSVWSRLRPTGEFAAFFAGDTPHATNLLLLRTAGRKWEYTTITPFGVSDLGGVVQEAASGSVRLVPTEGERPRWIVGRVGRNREYATPVSMPPEEELSVDGAVLSEGARYPADYLLRPLVLKRFHSPGRA